MLSSVSSANSLNVTALNTASLLAQIREARKTSFVDAPVNAVEPKNVKALYNDYVQFFLGDRATQKVGLAEIENILKDQLNAVLSLVSPGRTYDFPLDIAKILDENQLTNACKKGNEAYKFYVRKIVSELNNLHGILASAKENLSKLQNLIQTEDFGNPAVRELLTQLHLAELDGEAIKKTFSEYMVPKNFDILYLDVYSYNGKIKTAKTAATAKSAAQGSEAYTMPEDTEIDWNINKDWDENKSAFPSRIPDTVSSVDDLRSEIKTDKLTGERTVYTFYYKKGSATELIDRYDLSADVRYQTRDNVTRTDKTEISFFGELTLLDKLKYIVLYYTKDGTRRTFPENDAVNGFPCLPNPVPTGINPATGQDRKYTDDVNEIAYLEPFYIGFLVDRDGPVNALASFMEIKSAAIGEQIKVLGYRIKALRWYLRLINRGLEEMNKSQSAGNARIPNASYETLSMAGSNPTRCLKTLTVNGITKDYLILQQSGIEGKITVHASDNGCYLLVPADEEGIEAFIKYGNDYDYCYDGICEKQGKLSSEGDEPVRWGYMTQADYNEKTKTDYWGDNYRKRERKIKATYSYGPVPDDEIEPSVFKISSQCRGQVYNRELSFFVPPGDWVVTKDWAPEGNPFVYVRKISESEHCPLLVLEEPDESKLPRELGTVRMNITKLLEENYNGNTWNNCPHNKSTDSTYPSIVKNWTTTFDTVIGNVQTQLESVNKSIESLRNKINTFDESAMNFRNKAYTIYNKTVNKIE